VAAVGIVSSGVPQSCSGSTYSPSFICVSGGSLPGFYIKATSGLLAGVALVTLWLTLWLTSLAPPFSPLFGSPLWRPTMWEQDPAETTYRTELTGCTALTADQAAVVAFVSGPQQAACYVACKYGTSAYGLQQYVQLYPDLNAERPLANIFATATSDVSQASTAPSRFSSLFGSSLGPLMPNFGVGQQDGVARRRRALPHQLPPRPLVRYSNAHLMRLFKSTP
jgi:hypothetical protein